MQTYSPKFKEKMAARALSPGNSIQQVAKGAGIPISTLHSWTQRAKLGSMSSRSTTKQQRRTSAKKRSAEDKLRILTESSALSEEELGAFLRREGLHEADLASMRAAALAGLAPARVSRGPNKEQKQISSLARELRRKEKALAESAALLVLQKKFRALMADEGNDMDDDFGDNS